MKIPSPHKNAVLFFHTSSLGEFTAIVRQDSSFCVRGLCIATVQYPSLCVSAVVFTLGGDDIEGGVPDREKEDSERGKVEVGEKQEKDKHEGTTNVRSNM